MVAIGSTTLPSLDVVVEGHAEPLDDEAEVRRIAEMLNSNNWPLEARGVQVFGPNGNLYVVSLDQGAIYEISRR